MRRQSGGGCGTERQRGPNLGIGQPVSSLSVAVEEARQTLGDGPTRARRFVAVESSDRQGQTNHLTTCRQIGGLSVIATMNRSTDRSTSGAASMIALRFSAEAKRRSPVTEDLKNTTAGKMTEKGHPRI